MAWQKCQAILFWWAVTENLDISAYALKSLLADKGVPYEFKDAYQLLADFFNEVDRVIKEAMK